MYKTLLMNWATPGRLLRVGLGFVFIYAATSSLVNPQDWVGYLPGMVTDHISGETALKLGSVGQLILAVWLLSGIYVRYAALLAAVMLAGIVVVDFGQLLITFRDVGLMFAALALAAMPTTSDRKS